MSGIQLSIKPPLLPAAMAVILQIMGCRSRPAEPRRLDNGPAQTAKPSAPFSAPSEGARDPGKVLRTLIAQATSSSLRRIEVFYEPPSIENIVALNPETIRRQSKYRIEIWPPRLDDSLLQVLKQTSVRRSEERPEINWALDITLKDGTVRQICVDDSRKRGYLDGVPVLFSGELGGWLAQFTSGMR